MTYRGIAEHFQLFDNNRRLGRRRPSKHACELSVTVQSISGSVSSQTSINLLFSRVLTMFEHGNWETEPEMPCT